MNQEHSTASLIDDLRVALSRRGPDSIGSKKLVFQSESKGPSLSKKEPTVRISTSSYPCNIQVRKSESELMGSSVQGEKSTLILQFLGATLHLRGINPSVQPLIDNCGNILAYNGTSFVSITHTSNLNICIHYCLICSSSIFNFSRNFDDVRKET